MASFLLEVGTEELPARFVDEALAQWRARIPAQLAALNLVAADTTGIEYYGTPRRLAVLIKGLPMQQADVDEEIKGPPASAAFKDGEPTKAAIGFAQKQGVTIADFVIRPTDKGDFVFINQKIKGRPVTELLTELVPQWIMGLEGKRLMRWGNGDFRFSRPLRWLVALLDDAVLPIRFTNGAEAVYHSDRQSAGHRVLHPAPVTIPHAEAYVATLRQAFVEVDLEQRRSTIVAQAAAAAQKIGGVAVINPDLLQEVVNLVEYPTAVVGQFDTDFLALPAEVAMTEMESHQRYFPVRPSADAKELLPYFITIANGDPAKADVIAAGNQRVIRARLSDGKFFFDADRKQSLADFLPKLETLMFQADLGSVAAKVQRMSAIATHLCDQFQIKGDDRAHILRATQLCKADLVSQMVGEFPDLQGVMGEKYARHSGEPEAVAIAIMEHYLPKGAGDRLPQTLTGQIVGMVDRLDTLVSIFGLGMIPTGSSDPFALRRAANAIVNVAWDADLALNVQAALAAAIANFAQQHSAVMKVSAVALAKQLQDFFLQRLQTLLKDEQGVEYDLITAVLGDVGAGKSDAEYADRALSDVLDGRNRALFLQSIRTDGRLAPIYAVVNRASKLAAQGTLDTKTLDVKTVVKPELFQKNSEQALYDAIVLMPPDGDFDRLVTSLSAIAPALTNFFDGDDSVMVMDSDPAIKQNRLNLLGVLRNHARSLADFGAIVKS
jgi:glycyl-tRNA synthetase beta chain